MHRHSKELSTNRKFDKLMQRLGYILLQKAYSFKVSQNIYMHVSVCKGFDRLYANNERLILVEIKSRIQDCPSAIEKVRQMIRDNPYLSLFEIWVVGWKGGKSRLDKRTNKKVWLERGFFIIYKSTDDFTTFTKVFYERDK